ncbi:E protein [African pouched rat arterivirus]|uniref:E protein n=1 Tax=African pouched rat arterivirus TaxID=1965064 RepID=A0A0B5JSN7_9NIDO|nr:E protein [African pouched rat arterivirus]AJG06159.1 E protein [African pouched rat arterivirus]
MGSVWSIVSQAVYDAFVEFVTSVLDIVLFLGILFALTFAAKLVGFFIILVFRTLKSCKRDSGGTPTLPELGKYA